MTNFVTQYSFSAAQAGYFRGQTGLVAALEYRQKDYFRSGYLSSMPSGVLCIVVKRGLGYG